MHKISIHEVRGVARTVNFHESPNPVVKETVVGLRAEIEPPVDVNPDAVQRYVKIGRLAEGYTEGPEDFNSVTLLGSTAEVTVIYAGVHPADEQTKRKEALAGRVAGYLNLMGLETEIR